MLWSGNRWEKTKVMRISRELFILQSMIDQQQLENVEYCNYFGNKVTNDARCACEIKAG
jgi:hypothetical protein